VTSSFINDPAHWRQRTNELRALAEGMKDENAKQQMLRTADDYERLVKRAEERGRGGSLATSPERAETPGAPCGKLAP
jgi:hypothetical protein